MNTKQGFTLIELTTAIVIMAILGAVAGMGIVQIANGYSFAKQNTTAAEQAQVALTRIAKELTNLQSINALTSQTNSAKIRYYSRIDTSWHTLAWSSDNKTLTLDDDKLLEKVESFSLTYLNTYDDALKTRNYSTVTSVIEIAFELSGYNNIPITFVQRAGI